MAARFAARRLGARAEIVGRAEELRARVEPLADADAEAYGAFMAERSDENVERIVAIPFELGEIAAEVAELAAAVAAEGNPNVSGDAAAGADLAAAVASIAARLVGDQRATGRRSDRRRPPPCRPSRRCGRTGGCFGRVLGTVPGTCPENGKESPRRCARKRSATGISSLATTPRRRRR